ncbi:monosaccharide-sensing protein 2-like [Rhodamnia argentea]|uniref:Monosaccharide-sensing protein 2-like n=1 Tax=Rhodamnia argentea TaxID=178133 RepID=A0A8B8R009_9MYRT|nr:monosaccharide-sensing protein 2-like [Rhodamnia argentea]
MSRTVLIAVVAAFGNLLQGWDNATIAGAILFIKREFHLESEPAMEGLIVAISLLGATLVAACSGAMADCIGRRPMLILSSNFYLVSGLLMFWSPNLYTLLLARFVGGLGVGLAVTLVPLYVSELSPPEIRGLLNTLPQFSGSCGMFVAYCLVFGLSLMHSRSWRLMLGVLSIPSLVYVVLAILLLPESPRWLVSKGRVLEAKKVLQVIRGAEDVSGEMALLIEGIGVGCDASTEEYLIRPANDLHDDPDLSSEEDQILIYKPEKGISWVARPVTAQDTLGLASLQGSQTVRFVDPLVNLFGRVHEKLTETASMRSTLFPHLGSLFSVGGQQQANEEDEEEIIGMEGDEYPSDAASGDSNDNLQSPLISRQATSTEKDWVLPAQGRAIGFGWGSLMQGTGGPEDSVAIGPEWQLAWKWPKTEDENGKKGGFQRIYLRGWGVVGSRASVASFPGMDQPADGGLVQAVGLVGRPALFTEELLQIRPWGPAMLHPSEVATKGLWWRDLFEPGVKHALFVGVGIQILQQFSGINGVLYYTPQILKQTGIGALLSELRISSESVSLLLSAITTLLMLPSIAVAMRLMDVSGRRSLLLGTIPMLIVSLVIVVLGDMVNAGSAVHAVISTIGVVLYICFFVMGFGPAPNVLCAEIFPTRVRGLCVAMCGLAFWMSNAVVAYSLPLMLRSASLASIFGMFTVLCLLSWAFVFVKVPETKGMPLEVITEFFCLGMKQIFAVKNE